MINEFSACAAFFEFAILLYGIYAYVVYVEGHIFHQYLPTRLSRLQSFVERY
jgi:hypothetical protein